MQDVDVFTDVKARDGKRGQYDGCYGRWTIAWTIVVRLPLLVLVVLPVALISSALRKTCCCLTADDNAEILPEDEWNSGDHDEHGDGGSGDLEAAKGVLPLEQRKFDVVFLGASGFTGRLAVRYMAAQYANSVKWALAGRSIGKLEQLRAELAAEFDPELAKLQILIVNVTDDNSLAAMCSQTRVVATSVGPFAKYGTPVVRQCVAHGCAMVDTTGEAAWVRECTRQYYRAAQASGARIVNFCGHDCIPADLCVMQVFETLVDVNPNEMLARVELFDDGRGQISGGTLETVFYHQNTYRPPQASFNPLDLERDGSRSDFRIESFTRLKPGYSATHDSWYAWFYLSAVNMACVRRSNVIKHYGAHLEYKEQLVLPSLAAAIAWVINNALLAFFLFHPFWRAVASKLGMLPVAGKGPSEAEMDKGYYVQHGHGFGDMGSRVSVQMYFPTDTLYRLTAQMFVESALCFALEGAELEDEGGFFTPASCLGPVLRNRLLEAGICEIETKIDAVADVDFDVVDDFDNYKATAYMA
ncbi:Saccharopine dehydrogenase-like oxidoreductase [Hondaea fermentalgiana]|uniref:Saccharopine dehydrogenase-like oxidoreductase n=1 Tax=Hondaea fermentalgiana TaxID=2315210 RepID=A0A2R5G9K0_9STRA|nr:Saccharopine dehydrogenase-like oxidoreductase [Hondaea fermentalgiana]|eukprot:GBG27225.1 Saccharopine dehydrogenase-like oxidoreductase [Hondaea fermentalgiana]